MFSEDGVLSKHSSSIAHREKVAISSGAKHASSHLFAELHENVQMLQRASSSLVARARKEKRNNFPPPPLFLKNVPRNNNNKKKQRGSPITSLSAAPDSLCAALSPAGPHSSPSRQRQAIQRPLNHDWSGNPFRNQWD